MIKNRRNNLLAKIHIAKGQLRIDDETYRHMLMLETGKRSAGKMEINELEKILRTLTAKGFKAKPKTSPGPSKRALASDPQSRFMRSLWIQLNKAGKVNDPTEKGLAHWVKNQTTNTANAGVDALQFLTKQQKWQLTERLKQWLAR